MTDRVGVALPDWEGASLGDRVELHGRTVTVEPLRTDHVGSLAQAFLGDDEMWTYMGYGPFTDEAELVAMVQAWQRSDDPRFFAFVVDGAARGWGAYLRIDAANGVIEIGHLALSASLRRSTPATEAIYLLMEKAFDGGFRRLEWKCDALNERSKLAAVRLGFTFEGVFRNHMVYKGRNRDTAWYSIVDRDWPRVGERLRAWLDPSNFDEGGRQLTSLSASSTSGV